MMTAFVCLKSCISGRFAGQLSSFAAVLILDKLNYFSGFFAGLGEFVLTLAILIYSGAFFVVLGIVLLIIHVVSHIKNRKLPEKT